MKESLAKLVVFLIAGAMYLWLYWFLYYHHDSPRNKDERNYRVIGMIASELLFEAEKDPKLVGVRMSTLYETPGKLMVLGKVPNELALERLKKIINEPALPVAVYWEIEIGSIEHIQERLKYLKQSEIEK